MRTRQSIRHIPVHRLVSHGSNVRDELGDVEELACSIAEHGVLQPLVVTEHPTDYDRWLLLAGHRRAAAAARAGLTTVPCVIRHGLDEDPDEQLLVMLVENCQRRDLTPLDKAEAYGALRSRGLPVSEIARRVGLAVATIHYYLTLLDLDEESREQLRNGALTAGVARDAVRTTRREQRKKNGAARNGRPVQAEPPHLTRRHPLAKAVKQACTHTTRPLVGNTGCGQCWEATIRADERGDLP